MPEASPFVTSTVRQGVRCGDKKEMPMQNYLYLSLIPESLVASMLPPEEFGAYLATGTRKRPHGRAMFFQIAPDFQSDYFDLASADRRCVPHPDGQPKHSVYLSIYRALEHIPARPWQACSWSRLTAVSWRFNPASFPRNPTDRDTTSTRNLLPSIR